jgi:hypothetical protein
MSEQFEPTSQMGEDGIGKPITLNGHTLWVNEEMIVSMIIGLTVALETVFPDSNIGEISTIVSDSIYGKIKEENGPDSPEKTSDQPEE